jgi:hypothetical protein
VHHDSRFAVPAAAVLPVHELPVLDIEHPVAERFRRWVGNWHQETVGGGRRGAEAAARQVVGHQMTRAARVPVKLYVNETIGEMCTELDPLSARVMTYRYKARDE